MVVAPYFANKPPSCVDLCTAHTSLIIASPGEFVCRSLGDRGIPTNIMGQPVNIGNAQVLECWLKLYVLRYWLEGAA